MNSKKLITLLVLTTLLLGLVPIITVNAISITGTFKTDGVTGKTDGHKGQKVAVIGTGVTGGKNVELYWDLVQAWSSVDGAGLVNTSKAKASGDYEIWFKIPEATLGVHYLWVRDTETGDTLSTTFTVNSYVDLSASSGLEGDKVDVDLYGFVDETDVAILMLDFPYSTTAIPAAETLGTGGTATHYEFTLAHTLVENSTLIINDGTTTFTDTLGDGTLTSAGGSGTIDYLTGDVELDYTVAPGAVTIQATAYSYFVKTLDTTYVFSSGVETNEFGSVSKRVTLPDEVTEMGYGDYIIYAYDGEGNSAYDYIDIGAVITLDVDEGPVGTVVEIKGAGFAPGEKIGNATGEVYITDGITDVDCAIVDVNGGILVDSSGDFKLEIVIPSVDIDDYDTIIVDDGWVLGPNVASADFEILGEASFEVNPKYGVQGTTINIHGYNFTQIADEEVVLKLYSTAGAELLDIKTFETESDGEFEGTFTVPARTSDAYILTCNQTDWSISSETSFRIGMMIVILSPDDGPSGTRVTITGTGFSDGKEWNATFGDLDLITDGDVDGDGNLGVGTIPSFYVPSVDPGVYTITVLDIDTEIEVEVEFTVTDSTMVELDPPQAPQDYNVSIIGKYFAADDDDGSDVSLEFVLWNETDDWDLEVYTFADEPTNRHHSRR